MVGRVGQGGLVPGAACSGPVPAMAAVTPPRAPRRDEGAGCCCLRLTAPLLTRRLAVRRDMHRASGRGAKGCVRVRVTTTVTRYQKLPVSYWSVLTVGSVMFPVSQFTGKTMGSFLRAHPPPPHMSVRGMDFHARRLGLGVCGGCSDTASQCWLSGCLAYTLSLCFGSTPSQCCSFLQWDDSKRQDRTK